MRFTKDKSVRVISIMLICIAGIVVALYYDGSKGDSAQPAEVAPASASQSAAEELVGSTELAGAREDSASTMLPNPDAGLSAASTAPLGSGVLEVLALAGDEHLNGVVGVPIRNTEIQILSEPEGEELFSVVSDSEGRFEVRLESWSRNDVLLLRPKGHCAAFWLCDGGAEARALNQGDRVTVTREFLPAAELMIELHGLPAEIATERIASRVDVYRSSDERRMYIASEFEGLLDVEAGTASFQMSVPVGVKMSLLVRGKGGATFSHDTESDGLMILARGEERTLHIELGSSCSLMGQLIGVPDEFIPACSVSVEYVLKPSQSGAAPDLVPRQQRSVGFGRSGSRKFQFIGLPLGSRRLLLGVSAVWQHIPLRDVETGMAYWGDCQSPEVAVEPSEPLIGFVWTDESGSVVSDHRFSLARDEESFAPPTQKPGGIHVVPASQLVGTTSVSFFSDRFGFRTLDLDGVSLQFTHVVKIEARADLSAAGSLKVNLGVSPPEDLAARLVRVSSTGSQPVFWGSGWEGGLTVEVHPEGWIFPAVPPGDYLLNLRWVAENRDVPTPDAIEVAIQADRESIVKLTVPSRPTSIHVRVSNWELAPRHGVNYEAFVVNSTGLRIGDSSRILILHDTPGQNGEFDLAFVGPLPTRVGLKGPWMMEGAPIVSLQFDPVREEYFLELPFAEIESFDLLIPSASEELLAARGDWRSLLGDTLYATRRLPADVIPGGIRVYFYAGSRPHGTAWDDKRLVGWFDLRDATKKVVSELGGREITIGFSNPSGLVEVFAFAPALGVRPIRPTSLGILDTARQSRVWVPSAARALEFRLIGSRASIEIPVQAGSSKIRVAEFGDESR